MEHTRPVNRAFFILLTGVCAISTGAILARMAHAPALTIAAFRVGIASVVLLPVTLIWGRSELKKLVLNDILWISLSGAFLAGHFATWISSLEYTSVANSVVLVNTNPLWVAIFTPLITKDRLRLVALIGIAMSVAGGIIIGMEDLHANGQALWGDFLAVIGSVCAAFYLLLGRKLRQRLSLMAYIAICYGSAAIILWIVVAVKGLPITGFDSRTWACMMGLGLFTQLVGHTSYNWALKWFSADFVAVSLLGEPIGSTLLAYILFDEGLTLHKIIGGGLIMGAIYICAASQK